MEWIIIFGFIAPVIFVVGVVVCIRWLMNGGSSEREIITKSLRDLAKRQANTQVAAIVSTIAEAVAFNRTKSLGSFVINDSPSEHTENPIPVASQTSAAPTAWSEQSAAPSDFSSSPASQEGTPTLKRDMGDIFAQLDNINVLLYLGAFLVVVSVGIFVGYNFAEISGIGKTALVAAFALLFYVSGLILYKTSQALKPAGITFSAIGLIVIPLVGLAYYNFVPGAQVLGPVIWVAVSIASLLAGAITFVVIRQQFISYFMTLSILSLTESIVHASQLPVYYLAWGMLLTGAIFTLLARTSRKDAMVAEPMSNSALIMVPAAIILSLYYSAEQGIGQLGATAVFFGN